MEIVIANPSMTPVNDPTQVSEARWTAQTLAEHLAFDTVRRAEAAIVATEIATNVLKHAVSGEVWFLPYQSAEANRLDIVGIDRGPGIPDIARSMEDGFSTAGSAGQGLGAIRRLTDVFDLLSVPGKVTAVLGQLNPRKGEVINARVAGVSLAVEGETVSGDGWAQRRRGKRETFLVVDGLGHGPGAAEAAEEATKTFLQHPEAEPADIMESLHHALKKTRGAAAAIAEADPFKGSLRYCGVGNISAVIIHRGERPRSLVSYNGTIGHVAAKIQELTYPFHDGDLLIMHSDGVSMNWDLAKYPGAVNRHPALIAALLQFEARRKRDDSTVLVARLASE